MDTTLLFAVIAITLALALYSVGVWAERIQKRLKPWHAAVFWAGFACDTLGTALMGTMAAGTGGGGGLNFHAVTGMLAIALMLFHAIWATVVLARKNETMMRNFHKFSLLVWIVWLVPYLSGLAVGMGMGA